MKTEKVFTKKAFALRSFRLPEEEVRLWQAAAAKLGISQSEFLRRALQEKTQGVLIRAFGQKRIAQQRVGEERPGTL